MRARRDGPGTERTPPPDPAARSGGGPGALLPLLAEVACAELGAEPGAELLRRLGERLGRNVAAGGERAAPPEARLAEGLAGAAAFGLGRLALEELRSGAPGPRVVVRLEPVAEREPPPALVAGFVEGLCSGVLGRSLEGEPEEGSGARLVVQPREAEGAADPAGGARFFLGSMGRRSGEEDISLDALLEHTTDAIVLLDTDEVIRFWNQGAEEMFGWSRAEAVGRPAGFILSPDLRERDELGWIRRHLAAGGTLENHVTRRMRRDGTELFVSLTRTVLRDRQGEAVGSTAVIRDITDQRRTEEELAHARTLAVVGELSAKLAHEIKNPLAGIYAAVQLLARGAPAEDPRRAVLDDVMREVRRVDETVQELLSFARPRPPRPRATQLSGLVREVLEDLRHQPDLERHEVRVDVPPGLFADLDPRLLGEALSNLLLNAAQAMPVPGTVGVAAVARDGRVELSVTDGGPGLDESDLERAFEPFFTTKSRGTGLGLAIARKNVEAHGGTLVARPGSGAGATFVVSLPAGQGPPPPEPAP